jgi:hypothetical protein
MNQVSVLTHALPTSLPNTHKLAFKSIHSELELIKHDALALSLCQDTQSTYPCHAKRPENSSTLATHGTAVLDLGRPCIAMHLTELQLRLCPCPLGQRCVADDVAERLPGGAMLV